MSRPRFPPPKNFKPSDGAFDVRLIPAPSFASKPFKLKGSAGKGLAYEKKAHFHLQARYSPQVGEAIYFLGEWIAFHSPAVAEERYAQPDGLLFDFSKNLIVIVEMKLRHTQKAWWGLRRLYEPLVKALFPSWHVALCEVVHWYDPAVFWPEQFNLVRDLTMLRRGEFGVHILSPSMMRDQQLASLAAIPQFPTGLPWKSK